MKSLLVVGLVATGCYQAYGPSPAYGTMAPEPVTVAGPPGGAMDPGTEYQAPQNPDMPGYPDGYPQGGYPQGSEYGQGGSDQGTPQTEPGADPQAANNAMGMVTDAEIDSTLQPYGEWVSDDEYGRIWRPYATTVGVNFTPYETCGSWVYTDFGWTYQACDEWSWGWLPFHYGQWDWIDSSWCWVPDYTWSPGWVDWRYGGDTVGWRPTHPHRGSILRDHRDGRGGGDTLVRDHRRGARESDWRFVHTGDLGKHNLSAHTIANAEGLRSTADVARPPATGVRPTRTAASVMTNRLSGRVNATRGNPYASRNIQSNRVYPQRQPQNRGYYNGGTYQQSRGYQPPAQPNRGYQTYQPSRGYQPNTTYQPNRGYQPNTTYQPNRGYQPSRGYQPNTTYQPNRGYQGTASPSRGSQPSRSYQSSPSRGSYSAPSRSSSSSSRPSSSSSSSRSSSSSSSSRSSSSSSSSHSSGSSSSHSGGGGRHK